MNNEIIEITCKNTGTVHSYPFGCKLIDVYNDIKPELKSGVIAALVNNELKELSYKIYNPKQVEFIDISHPDGMRTYIRSLTFLLQVAVNEVLPGYKLTVDFSVSKGLYCAITNNTTDYLDAFQVLLLGDHMRDLVAKDLPFIKKKLPTTEAMEMFTNEDYTEKALLAETRGKFYTSVYYLNDHPDSFYGPLVHTTKALNKFGLIPYNNGALLVLPKPSNPSELEPTVEQNKMLQIFDEHKDWVEILGARSIGAINKLVQNGKTAAMIQINEALQEKKYAQIADKIAENKDIKLVLIAGPSSSGKTTSAKRIGNQLRVAKLRPLIIELDNYFVDREHTPRDKNGDYDFESLHAVNLSLFNEQMTDLLNGKEVILPKFDFTSGTSSFKKENAIQMLPNDILILEGIHGLNPQLIESVDSHKIFRVYASALTSLSIDENNRIPTTDNRLIRRIVRDAGNRGYSAADTISRWQSVRRGEEANIFLYQENADMMFNSSLVYELCVLRKYVEPLLRKVPPSKPEYAEALRLLKFISYFEPIDYEHEGKIPPTSVLREFIGNSSFKY